MLLADAQIVQLLVRAVAFLLDLHEQVDGFIGVEADRVLVNINLASQGLRSLNQLCLVNILWTAHKVSRHATGA